MANNFADDANCVALYRFESGALTTDSKGTNTLVASGAPSEDTTNYKEGACSANFTRAGSDLYNVQDVNLSSDFPLKGATGNKTFSIVFHVRFDSIDQFGYLIAKQNPTTAMGFGILFWEDTGTYRIRFFKGYSGTSYETFETDGFNAVVGNWYHVAVTYDDSTKDYFIKIWDFSGSTGVTKSGTATYNIIVNTQRFTIACTRNSGSYAYFHDGNLDEVVIFNDVLTEPEIDQIRQGTYGPTPIGTTAPMPTYFRL